MPHTKGPWKVYRRGFKNAKHEEFEATFWIGYGETESRGPDTIVQMVHPCLGLQSNLEKNYHEARANAHLIAAAPDMLAFLKMLATEADAPQDNELSKQLFDLIAKAEGKA